MQNIETLLRDELPSTVSKYPPLRIINASSRREYKRAPGIREGYFKDQFLKRFVFLVREIMSRVRILRYDSIFVAPNPSTVQDK